LLTVIAYSSIIIHDAELYIVASQTLATGRTFTADIHVHRNGFHSTLVLLINNSCSLNIKPILLPQQGLLLLIPEAKSVEQLKKIL
jgi:hypothetical protein